MQKKSCSSAAKLGDGGQVPVGIGDLDVAQEGAQGEDLLVHVRTLLAPAQKGTHRHRVSHVVQPGSSTLAVLRPTELATQLREGVNHTAIAHGRATVVDEEGASGGFWMVTIPALGVLRQGLRRRRVERHQPRFAELAARDGEHTALEIHLVALQVQGL